MLMAAAIWVARCSISALRQAETNLTNVRVVGLPSLFNQLRAGFLRIACERFPRGIPLFLCGPGEERCVKKSLQAGKRDRIADLSQCPDTLHAQRSTASEKVDAFQNPQQRAHSLLHPRAPDQHH